MTDSATKTTVVEDSPNISVGVGVPVFGGWGIITSVGERRRASSDDTDRHGLPPYGEGVMPVRTVRYRPATLEEVAKFDDTTRAAKEARLDLSDTMRAMVRRIQRLPENSPSGVIMSGDDVPCGQVVYAVRPHEVGGTRWVLSASGELWLLVHRGGSSVVAGWRATADVAPAIIAEIEVATAKAEPALGRWQDADD